MDELKITIVGQDIFKEVIAVFEKIGIGELEKVNPVNEVRNGMLGNLKTLTYVFEIPEEKVISKRKELMSELSKNPRVIPMYVHGDWMRLCVFKSFKV